MVPVRVNKLAANVVGVALTLALCVAAISGVRLLPHYQPFAEWEFVIALAALVLLFPAHEWLHAVGLRRFAGVSWREIRFGVMWRALMPYCHCTVPISVRAYRGMALLPLWVTGGVTLVAVLAYPSDSLAILAAVAVAACIGDMWMVVKLRRFPDHLLVQDCPSDIGCDVLSPAPLPTNS